MKRLVALMRENSEKVLELLNNPSNKINKYIKDFCHALFNDEKYYFDNYRDFQCELEETVRLDTDREPRRKPLSLDMGSRRGKQKMIK